MLAGCTSGSKEAADKGKETEDKVTIRILTRIAGTSKQTQIYNEILDEFKEAHPEVEIVDNSQSEESAFNNLIASEQGRDRYISRDLERAAGRSCKTQRDGRNSDCNGRAVHLYGWSSA